MGKQRAGGWKQWKPEQARQVLKEWRASGLPLGTFAGERGIGERRLRWWRDRLSERRKGKPQEGGTRFVPAVVSAPAVLMSAPVAVTVRLPGDVTLEVSNVGGVPAQWLADVAKKLSGAG